MKATGIYRFSDDLLNRDCRRRDHAVYTNQTVDPSSDPALELDVFNKRRNEVALRFPGRIAMYFTMGSRYSWSDLEQRRIYGPRGFSWSNYVDEFVSMAAQAAGDNLLAHEIGHCLHLARSFWHLPATIADAEALIKKFVEVEGGLKDAALNLFDGDRLTDRAASRRRSSSLRRIRRPCNWAFSTRFSSCRNATMSRCS